MSITCDVCGEDDAPTPGVCIDCILRGEESLKEEIRRLKADKAELERALRLPPRFSEDDLEVTLVVRWQKHQWVQRKMFADVEEVRYVRPIILGLVTEVGEAVAKTVRSDLNPSNGGDGS